MIGAVWLQEIYACTLCGAMPKEIDSSEYWSASELIRELHVSRQTLWRWRRQRRIPVGRRFRDGQVLFTAAEADCVRHYANKVEPVATVSVNR
jgi:hypothetical protein